MPDRESAITHLQIISTWSSFARERDLQFFTAKHLEDISQWANDAIAMLKEQDETIKELRNAYGYLQKQFFEAQDKLLKEQEAKEGHWTVLDFCANEGIYCSECHIKIFDHITKPKKKLSQYCPHCGSRNDQFFRDGEVVFR